MATGFRPKSERIIELRGYSTDDLMLLAVEAARYLGWQMGTVRCDKAEFYTPTSFWSWPDKNLPSRGEFCICMPPEWNPEERWPIEWLLRCASMAGTGDEWMTCSHVLSEGTPLHSDTSMTAVLLTIPEEREEGAETCQLPGGDSVTFYQLVPVYAEEAAFRQANGFLALLEKMKDVPYIADTERENTCKEFVPWSEADGDEMSMDEKANTSLRSVLTFRKGNMATPLLVYMNVALFITMDGFGAEEIQIDGKAFEKISGVMEYPVAGGGTIKVNQSIVFHLNRQTLEGYILVIITSDDTYESEAQAMLESVRIKS